MKRIFQFTALPLAALVTAVALVSTASAHVALESSVPASGSTVSSSPANVVLTFAGKIQKAAGTYELHVTNAAGASATSGSPTVSTNALQLSVALQPGLPSSTYTVTWMQTSVDDGDAEEGTFSFAVGGAPVTQRTATSGSDHPHGAPAPNDVAEADHAPEYQAPTTGLIVVYLAPLNSSGVDGRAEIMPVDGGSKTQIGVYVSGIVTGSSHMNHVHIEASCSTTPPGPHAAELTDIASEGIPYGKSITVVDVPFSVIADGGHTIRVHAGATGGDKTLISCGEIPAQIEGAHSRPVSLPSTGDGSDTTEGAPVWAIALLAGFVVTGLGVVVRSKATVIAGE